MDNFNFDKSQSINMDCNGCVALRKLAATAELPQQVLECLIHCGYETISSVSDISEVKPIQTFLRENHFLLENSPKKFCIYGSYAAVPQKFSFSPKHVTSLKKFVKLCQAEAKISKWLAAEKQYCLSLTQTTTTQYPTPFSAAIPATGAVGLPTNCNQAPSLCDGAAGDTLNGSILSPSSESTCANEIAMSAGDKPAMNQLNSDTKLELDTYMLIKQKMQQWCSMHKKKNVQGLKIDQHYKIIVKHQALLDFLERGLQVLELDVLVLCCMCSTQVRLPPRKNSFLISNATRHLSNCIKNSKQKEKQKQMKETVPLQSVKSYQCDMDQEIIEELNVDNEVEVSSLD